MTVRTALKSRPCREAPSRALDDVLVHLRRIRSLVVVAAAALREQNCELDEDIAQLLQHAVAEGIEDQIKRLRRPARPS